IALSVLGGTSAVACSTKSCARSSTSSSGDAALSDAAIASAIDAGAEASDAEVDAAVPTNADGWPALAGFEPSVADVCGLFLAPSPTANHFPKPIAWEACDAALRTVEPQLACRQIAGKTSPVEAAYFDRPKKSVVLVVQQSRGADTLTLVADADGPVHQAIARAASSPCELESPSVSGTSVVYRITDHVPSKETISLGAYGGPIDGHLKAIRTAIEYKQFTSYVVGKSLLVGYKSSASSFPNPIASISWADGGILEPIAFKSEQQGDFEAIQFVGDDLFYSLSDSFFGRIEVFHAGNGAANFVFIGADGNECAINIGADSDNMVWNEAHQRGQSPNDPWTDVDVMTSAYTSDPGSIVKRKILSEPALTYSPWVVGCQFAAHTISEPAGNGIRIVRTWDGRSWTLRNSKSPKLIWGKPVAVTCDEIFVNVELAAKTTKLARIRLDSLGTGDAAMPL
ncbi:MAG: hypothetical protein ABI461_22350, partial [Polyangiaceae bacterium]